MTDAQTFTAFEGARQIASGDLADVARALAAAESADSFALVFDDRSGGRVELDLRHGPDAAVAEYRGRTALEPIPPTRPGRGRPKLGVVAREVTLLPRHWEWLAAQPGGASAALRRLVEDARRAATGPDRVRQARDAAYRVMSTLAGDLPGFEEASRALFAGDDATFDSLTGNWPDDVAAYLARLVAAERLARGAV